MKKKIGIRLKFTLMFLVLISIPLAILGTNSYLKSVDLTKNELEKSTLQLVTQVELSINNYLGGIEDNISYLESNSNTDDVDHMIKDFQNFKNSHKDIMCIYLGTKQKNIYQYPYQEKDSSYDPTQRPWYIKATTEKKLVWTKPYVDSDSKKLIISVAVPMYDKNNGNELRGVLAADIALETLGNMINKIKIGQEGYPVVVDYTGNVIFHRDHKLIEKALPVKKIVDAIKNEKESIVQYNWKENEKDYKKFAVFTTLEKLNWKIIGTMYIGELEEKTSIILSNTVFVGGISLLLAIVLAYIFARSLTNPIKVLAKDMEDVKKGDLSVRCKIKTHDEIGQLGENFNGMVEDLGKLIKKVQDVSMAVTGSSQGLAAISEMTSMSIQDVATTVDAIANGASEQAAEAEKGASLTVHLADEFNKLTNEFDDIKKSTGDVMEISEESMVVVDELKEKTQFNKEGTQKIESVIIALDNRIKHIGNILETIDGIAEQTNLLALNASIEAARAGDAGRGFAVVAEEIRKLAEGAKNSSGEIKDIIINVQEESNNAVEVMEEVKEMSLEQSQSVSKVNYSFEKILNSIDCITEKIEQISHFINHLNEDKDFIVESIQNISAISEETAAASEEVNASMQQQTTSIEEIEKAADSLDELASILNQETNRFKI
ncbi:methyl-accepting chemotaxis protein [Lutibacter sp. B2]|nr:methyl-accepting chemotaxis protein [Lutibacter sp. B2]